MMDLITEHIEAWTAAEIPQANGGRGRGRGANGQSPHGIKKLRELILELAVRGKLVPQDPTDEPASVLLEKIAKEKTRLVKEGKIKKQKPLPKITEDEKPYDLPEGWEWSRLGEISEANTGYAFKSTEYIAEGTFVLRVTNINPDGSINNFDTKFIDSEIAESTYKKFSLRQDDVLLVMVGGSLGKIGIVSENCLPAVLNQNMWKLDRFAEIALNYFVMGIRYINANQLKITHSTHGHLAQGEYMGKLFPLPPLAEQYRIVAKVDELMTLCDKLEQQQTDSNDTHQTLLVTLTNVADPAEFAVSWQRIAAHFDTLFTTEESIDQLKQTILQLAVMGKLVPQNPNDEPASTLLEKIAKEKARLIKEGKIKKQKPLSKISEDEKPFEVPEGWAWIHFDELINPQHPISYGVLVPGPDVEDGIPFVRIGDLDLNTPPLKPEKSIDKSVDVKYERTRVLGGEILMGVVGSIGKLGVAPDSWKGANIARAICRISPMNIVNKQYIIWLLQSEFMKNGFIGDTRTLAQPTLNVGLIRDAYTPLPPLDEQHRIVAKVDELMALCDTLKERLHNAQTTQVQLADAIVEQAVA